MARIPLVCPLDGSNLGAANANITPEIQGGNATGAVGDHYHLTFGVNLTCQQNGHRFVMFEQGITLTRTA